MNEIEADIARLTSANRASPDPRREQELVQLRHRAGVAALGGEPVGPWPPPVPDLFPDTAGLVDVAFDTLTPERLASGIFHHGAVLARGLFTAEVTDALRVDIAATLDAVDRLRSGSCTLDEVDDDLHPFQAPDVAVDMRDRIWIFQTGTVWVPDAPRGLFDLLEAVEASGLGDLLTETMGRRPLLSLTKFAMRRVPPDTEAWWHQDGAFLGQDTRAVNVWIAISDCGVDAPGLELVPARVDHLLETNAEPPMDFLITKDAIAELTDRVPSVVPEFRAGDALLFDQQLVHQTGAAEHLTLPRYAFECWFFCPSSYPAGQVPIAY